MDKAEEDLCKKLHQGRGLRAAGVWSLSSRLRGERSRTDFCASSPLMELDAEESRKRQ